MMHDDEARNLSLPIRMYGPLASPNLISRSDSDIGYNDLCRHWYDAALFCLHEAQFMRKANIRSVQAIAILGMCFNNFGDPDLGNHMWSCAIRTAQKLGIDNPDSQKTLPLSSEGQRRLWWTLVICEWYTFDPFASSMPQLQLNLDLGWQCPTIHHRLKKATLT